MHAHKRMSGSSRPSLPLLPLPNAHLHFRSLSQWFLPGSHKTHTIRERFVRLPEGGTGFEKLSDEPEDAWDESKFVAEPCEAGTSASRHVPFSTPFESTFPSTVCRNARPHPRFVPSLLPCARRVSRLTLLLLLSRSFLTPFSLLPRSQAPSSTNPRRTEATSLALSTPFT